MARATTTAFALASVAVVAVAPPGQLFDLSSWDLQTPVSNGDGGVVIIKQPQLATYTSEHFYTNETDLGMSFYAPINGAHTSGSKYARSELRGRPNFTFKGLHVMNVTMQVLRVSTKGVTTIGQVRRADASVKERRSIQACTDRVSTQ